jgi:bifunctional UDP-N-acetylglucosamine pyrophosphorylase/glucosamine-1-phosphate N-acetyltransferase
MSLVGSDNSLSCHFGLFAMTADKSARRCLAVVLAAGEGTRMKSDLPKVLHAIAGRSMLGHVLASVSAAGADAVAIVVGPGREDVAAEARRVVPAAEIFVQTERRGTAHAVLAAREAIARGYDDLLVVFADTPLVEPETFVAMRARLVQGHAVAALGFEADDPTGYGRLLLDGGELVAIREHKDATAHERAVRLCNAGLMALDGARALALLDAIGADNVQKEFYLTDAVAVARAKACSAVALVAPEAEVMGVNDRVQLAAAAAVWQTRAREKAMRAGATLVDPATVWLSHDTNLGRDVVVEQNVVFGPGVTVADGAVIHAFSHLEGASVGPKAQIGPFARLRPGAKLAEKAKIGNFVEIKNANLGAGAKVNHLSYVGDADIGAESNLGAGVITCNYDGFFKHRTRVGEGAFVGVNVALVAPVEVGAGAYIGTGSVVTTAIEPDALFVARAKPVVRAGWAKAFRERKAKEKQGG